MAKITATTKEEFEKISDFLNSLPKDFSENIGTASYNGYSFQIEASTKFYRNSTLNIPDGVCSIAQTESCTNFYYDKYTLYVPKDCEASRFVIIKEKK